MVDKFMAILAAGDDYPFCLIVNAPNKQGAYQKFIEYYAPSDGGLKEYICDVVINAGLIEVFARDTDGYFLDESTGEIRVGIEYMDQQVEENIKKFFGQYENYAEIYLEHINNQKTKGSIEPCEIPTTMMSYVALKIDWYGYGLDALTITPFSEIESI